MRKIVVGTATCLLLMGAGINAHANLLKNPGFDSLSDENGNTWTTVGTYGSTLSGLAGGATTRTWDVFAKIPYWTTGFGAGIEIQKYGAVKGFSPDTDPFYVELDSDGGSDTNSSMYQEIALAAGSYELSFMYQGRTNGGDNDNGIKAFFQNGSSETEIVTVSKKFTDTNFNWETIAWTFTIPVTGIYKIGFAAYGNDNTLGGFIDSVALNPVPEPATTLLFGAGLAGLAGLRLRRRK